MAISFDVEDKDLTPRERLQKAEEQRLNFKQMRLNEAHDRFMQSHDNWVRRHPNAASIADRQRVFGNDQQDRLQAHERAMLEQRGKIDLGVAHEKRMGMKEQGVDAANASGEWGFKTEHERGQNALSLEEKKSELQKELAAIEAATKKYGFDKGLEGEQERQAGALDVETQRGKSAAEIAKENREAAAAEAEKLRQERLQSQDNKNNQNLEKRVTDLLKLMENNPAYSKLTPAEKRQKALELAGGGSSGALSQFRQ